MKKRYRRLQAKPGELKAQWGKAETYEDPDLCYAWGAGIRTCDGRLLHSALTQKWSRTNYDAPLGSPRFMWSVYDPSFVEELESRGYDLTTLKFSIQKKVQKMDEEPT